MHQNSNSFTGFVQGWEQEEQDQRGPSGEAGDAVSGGDRYTVCKKPTSSTLLTCVLERQVIVSLMVFSTFHHKNR